MIEDQLDQEAEPVSFIVTNLRPINAKNLIALLDVEMRVAGISFDILGVQARKTGIDGVTVFLPTFKDTDGAWRPAIRLPEELRRPLGDAVIEFIADQKLIVKKFTKGGQEW